MKEMVRVFIGLGMFAAILFFLGCAQMGSSSASSDSMESTTISASTTVQGSSTVLILPDVPVPVELKRDDKNTMLISTPTYKGGVFVFKGNVTSQSVADFFSIEMPKYGWEPTGSISANKKFLGFAKAPKSSALIQIEDKLFYTLVQIWVSEPTTVNTVIQEMPPK